MSDRKQDELQVLLSGDIRLEPKTKSVRLKNTPIPLKGLSYRFLETLLLSNNQLLTQQELAQKVWGRRTVSDETIAQRASLLRKAIQDNNKVYFESVRGSGYQWLQNVEISVQCKNSTNGHPAVPPVLQQRSIAALKLALLFATLLATAGYFLLSSVQPLSNSETSESKSVQPLLLERANDYAKQSNEVASSIALDLYRQLLNDNTALNDTRFAYAKALIERTAKYERNTQYLDEADTLIAKLEAQTDTRHSIKWLRGYHQDVSGNINRAIAYYEQSLKLNEEPKARTAGSLAYLYTQKGRLFEATELNVYALEGNGLYRLLQLAEIFYLLDIEPLADQWIQAAYQFAPDDSFTAIQYAEYLFSHQHFSSAKEVINNLHRQKGPTSASRILLTLIEIKQSNWQAAKTTLAQAHTHSEQSTELSSIRYWFANKKGNSDTVSRPNLIDDDNVWPNVYVAQSIVYIAENDFDGALAELNRAFRLGFINYRYLLSNPLLDPLHHSREFTTLISNMRSASEVERAKIELRSLPKLNHLLQVK